GGCYALTRLDLTRHESLGYATGSGLPTPSWIGRFMERLHSLLRMHRDREPERAQRRAGVPPAPRARQRERDDRSAVGFAARRQAGRLPYLRGRLARVDELTGGTTVPLTAGSSRAVR